jgi:hypothetical protein
MPAAIFYTAITVMMLGPLSHTMLARNWGWFTLDAILFVGNAFIACLRWRRYLIARLISRRSAK